MKKKRVLWANEPEQALTLRLEGYEISGRLVGTAAAQSRDPLLLAFFCEAYRGQDVGVVERLRFKGLFDRYWRRKLLPITERLMRQGAKGSRAALTAEVHEFLLNVASFMLHQNTLVFPLSAVAPVAGSGTQRCNPLSIYEQIRAERIILEQMEPDPSHGTETGVAFVYDEFMKYMMARSLMRDWVRAKHGEAAIRNETESLLNKDTAASPIAGRNVGVLLYLTQMSRDGRDLPLWTLLAHRGERWHRAVFETFRKLPAEKLDAGAFDALAEMLGLGDERLQEQVLETLKMQHIGQVAPAFLVARVCELLEHRHESIRQRAVEALGLTTAVESALPALIQALDDSSHVVRRAAAVSLGKLKDARVVEPLSAALKDNDERVRLAAAEALHGLGEPVFELLGTLLRTGTAQVQIRVAETLGHLAHVQGIEPLIVACSDSRLPVRRAAADALGRIGEPAVPSLLAALESDNLNLQHGAMRALGHLWQIPALTQLGSSDWKLQSDACRALAQHGDRRAVEPLVVALQDRNAKVRLAAVEALCQLCDPRAVESLIVCLSDDDARVRLAAAQTLGQLGDARAVEPLIDAFNDSDLTVRKAAADALDRLGEPALKPLVSALRYRTGSVQRAAAHVLADRGDARTVEAFRHALETGDGAVKWEAVRALARIGTDDALTALRRHALQEPRHVRTKQILTESVLPRVAMTALAAALASMRGRLLKGL